MKLSKGIALFAGFSAFGSVLFIVSSLLFKNQSKGLLSTLWEQYKLLEQQEWFKNLKVWLNDFPIKNVNDVTKPVIDITATTKGA